MYSFNRWKTSLTLNSTGGVVSASIVHASTALPIDYSTCKIMDTNLFLDICGKEFENLRASSNSSRLTQTLLVSMLEWFFIGKDIHKHACEEKEIEKYLQAILILFTNSRKHCGQCPTKDHKIWMLVWFAISMNMLAASKHRGKKQNAQTAITKKQKLPNLVEKVTSQRIRTCSQAWLTVCVGLRWGNSICFLCNRCVEPIAEIKTYTRWIRDQFWLINDKIDSYHGDGKLYEEPHQTVKILLSSQ